MENMEEYQLLGIEIIDTQHAELINKGNYLIKLLQGKELQDEILDNYNEFVKLIENHFLTEESLFNSFDYKESKSHIDMHRFFLDTLLEPKNNYIEFNIPLSNYVLNFLNEWAKNHITTFDLEFAKEYLKQQ